MKQTYRVETIKSRSVVVMQRGNGIMLVAELPYRQDGYPETVEIGENPEYDGMGVDLWVNGVQTLDGADLAIYADRRPSETDADVVERLGLPEETLLPGVC